MKVGIGALTNERGHLAQHGADVGLHPQVGGKAPHRVVLLDRVDVDMGPPGARFGLHELGQPGHIDIEQQTDVGAGQYSCRIKTGETVRLPGDAQGAGHVVDHRHAAQLRQIFQRGHGLGLAPKVGRDRHRPLGRQQPIGDALRPLGVDAAEQGRAITLRLKSLIARANLLGQHLTRQGHENRPGRLAVHHRMGAAQGLTRHHGSGQVVFPFDVGAHQTADIKRVLHKMHIVVTRTGQLAAQRKGRLARHQHHRQARAQHVVHAHDRVGRTGINMHHDRLSTAGQGSVTGSHVHRHVFMRTQDELRMGSALRVPARELLDQADMVRPQIGEHMLDTQIGEPLQKVMGAAGAGRGLWGHEGAIVNAGPSRTVKA